MFAFTRKIHRTAILLVVPVLLLGQAPGAGDSGQAVLGYLNQTLDWYHHIPIEQRLASSPEEAAYAASDQQLGIQILKLSFDFARAEGQPKASPQPSATNAAPSSQFQALAQAAAGAEQQLKDSEGELQGLRDKLPGSAGRRRQEVESQIAEVQSELDLAQARSSTIQNLLQFAGTAGSQQAGSGTLLAQIDEIERSVPELGTTASRAPEESTPTAVSAASAASNAATAGRPAPPSGVIGLIEDIFTLTGRIRTLDQTLALTGSLMQSMQKFRAPLIASLTAESQRGDQLLKEPDSTDPKVLAAQRSEFEALTSQFKRDSALVLPLGKQAILLGLYNNNLSRWRDLIKTQYESSLRNLLIRVVVLGAVLLLVFGLSEAWRRAAFRYIRDQRRRYQILLLRRIAVWSALSLTVVLFFSTEIGSLATFAGLITAGIAVALQNLILSVAGYFFLIGKYGVKVGDRVQISGVTGEVIDVGLVRMPLLELGGSGSTLQPTGRVVVFSNSIVFQPSASFYKQIPGTSFGWHEVTLMLAPDCDYAMAEKSMLEAVDKVYADYRASIERQYQQMEMALGVGMEAPRPKSRLLLNQAGLEVVIRYPVELENASAIDDRITRELLRAIDHEPRLRLVGSGTPNIQPVSVPAEHAEAAKLEPLKQG